MTKNEKKSLNQSLAEWKLFIYNPTTGEFLGRTAKSWGERAAAGRPGPASVPGAPGAVWWERKGGRRLPAPGLPTARP